jgi:hypothetical protein
VAGLSLSGFEEEIRRFKNISPIFIRENKSWWTKVSFLTYAAK